MNRMGPVRDTNAAWGARLLRMGVLGVLPLALGCGGGDGAGTGRAVAGDSAAAADSATVQDGAVVGNEAVRDSAPDLIRGLYLNAYAASSRNRLRHLIGIADSTEINAFVVDVKDERGIHYRSQLEHPTRITAPEEIVIRDLKAFADTLHAHGIWAIARVVVFKDPILSKAEPDWSVRKAGGGLWMDKAGNTWVSPWDERVWDYNLDIAEEAAKAT